MCYATVSLWENALPGWHLGRAEKNGRLMKLGDYGLFRSDSPMEPAFVWGAKPAPDPDPEDKLEDAEAWARWAGQAEILEKALVGSPVNGWRLVQSAIMSGWKLGEFHQRHPRFAHWLFDALGREVSGRPPTPTLGRTVDEIGKTGGAKA